MKLAIAFKTYKQSKWKLKERLSEDSELIEQEIKRMLKAGTFKAQLVYVTGKFD